MDAPAGGLFDAAVWTPALESYGAVTQLTVALYEADGRLVCGPVPITPLFATFQEHSYDPGLFADCATRCLLETTGSRPPIVVTGLAGLSVVGVSLMLHDQVVAALVFGYALVDFCESLAVGRLARESGAPFPQLWAMARRQSPVPVARLLLQGALLRVLGETLLRENSLRRQSDQTALKLAHLAHYDALTELPNRALLSERLERALTLAARHQRTLAVLFLDVDRFKHVNDSLGHQVGDELLRVVGHTVSQSVRGSDTVARQSGDEFIAVLSELTHASDAGLIAQKVIAALGEPHQVGGHEIRIGVSIGISVFPADGGDAETLLKHADMALYRAKELGRARYTFFHAELAARALEQRSVEAGLQLALAEHQFELVYQPQVNLYTGRVVGAEALIRWRHPQRGLIGPDAFVPIAEASGLIRPIGRWALYEACRQVKAWRDAGLRPIRVAVNVSAVEFRSNDLLKNVHETLTATGLDPECLELELTESVLMPQVNSTAAVLKALKGLGVQLAIDDFGTGWSSLSSLAVFPVDTLKIDQSFVHQITASAEVPAKNHAAASIVSAVIGMGRSLDLRVVAEGVETTDQLTFLQAEACGHGQGYYFGRPVVPDQFAHVLRESAP